VPQYFGRDSRAARRGHWGFDPFTRGAEQKDIGESFPTFVLLGRAQPTGKGLRRL
jgi:hypothetical protein